LYIDGVIYDYGFLPAGDRADRAELNSLSLSELLQKIRNLGLVTDNVDIRNKRRLIRLIETNGAVPTRQKLRDNTLIIGLKTDRAVLKQRVTKRVDTMLAAGLEDEVRAMAERYGWDCEGLKGVSYAQWRGHFEGSESREQARQNIIKATLDLAKRQRTWFKRNKSIRWFSTPVNWLDIVDSITMFLEN
jgi:tRNA dimethylallyltransferase